MSMRLACFAPLLLAAACASAPPGPPPEVVKALAPTGKLRAAINFGNPVLAQKDAATGEAKGVSVDLARELARRLGVPLEVVPFDAAGKVTDSATKGIWDIGFVAIDPLRAKDIAFTGPYVVIEGGYMVKKESPLKSVDEFDRKGIRIAATRAPTTSTSRAPSRTRSSFAFPHRPARWTSSSRATSTRPRA
jgi:polar amino acid transport system substrate-binding protein